MLTNANCYAMMYLVVGKCQQKETEVRRIKARGAIKFYDLYLRIFEKGYDINVVNTTCNATEDRQKEGKKRWGKRRWEMVVSENV